MYASIVTEHLAVKAYPQAGKTFMLNLGSAYERIRVLNNSCLVYILDESVESHAVCFTAQCVA